MDKELLAGLKAYTMSLYLGQHIGARTKSDQQYPITILPEHLNDERMYLQLRPLSSISETEAIAIAKIHDPNMQWKINHTCPSNICVGHGLYRLWIWLEDSEPIIEVEDESGTATTYGILSVYQYLQQQGFALPVFYKGVPYSVEKLVELQIIVLDK